MSRLNENDARSQDVLICSGLKLGQMDFVPADNTVITKDHPTVLRMTPAGAVDLLMPPSNEQTKGLVFLMVNVGAGGIITLKTSADAAFATAITIAVSGGWALVQCTGSPTANLGWREIASEIAVGT
jgi:hypothetical protein